MWRRSRKTASSSCPGFFQAEEVGLLKAELPALLAEETPANVIEKESGVVRTAMGLHLRSDVYASVFARLVRHPP